MMRPVDDAEVYLCRTVVDLRKSIDGSSLRVEQTLGLDPFAAQRIVFCKRKHDEGRILCRKRRGFVLRYKRLEKHRFPWPREANGQTLAIPREVPSRGMFQGGSPDPRPARVGPPQDD